MALFAFSLYTPILLSGLDSAHGKQMTQCTKEDDTYDLKTAKKHVKMNETHDYNCLENKTETSYKQTQKHAKYIPILSVI